MLLAACAAAPPPLTLAPAQLAKLTGGTPAPEVSFRGLDDQPHTLAEFKGKPVILALFAYWCPHCQEDLPKIQAWVDQTPGVLFLPVEASNGTKQQVADFKANYQIKADVYWGLSADDFRKLGGAAYPTGLFLSNDGGVLDRVVGMPPLDKYTTWLANGHV
jgi:thiol-disulfide isomerase/thioredoxin